jgi:hypothetical protein
VILQAGEKSMGSFITFRRLWLCAVHVSELFEVILQGLLFFEKIVINVDKLSFKIKVIIIADLRTLLSEIL